MPFYAIEQTIRTGRSFKSHLNISHTTPWLQIFDSSYWITSKSVYLETVNPFHCLKQPGNAFSLLTNTQDLLSWASACVQLLLRTRGLVARALHIWVSDSKSTMWILLIPHWEGISELRVTIHNGPNPKSPAEAAATSKGVQTQIPNPVTYPSSTGCACNINMTWIPGDKSKWQTCSCPSCASFTETGFSPFPITTGHTPWHIWKHRTLFAFLLQCGGMFLPIFSPTTVKQGKAQFVVYSSAVSL